MGSGGKKEWEEEEDEAGRVGLYLAVSRHGAWCDSVASKHVARLSLATSDPLARVCQRGSSVAPNYVA